MKITKPQLKALVKECLVELLTEGLGDATGLVGSRKQIQAVESKASRSPASRTTPSTAPVPVMTHALREAVRQESGGNNVLAAMLADTAEKTLPTFLTANRPGAPMPASGVSREAAVVDSTSPEELFGEDSASRWADLAFMDVPAKKSA